ncbi:class I SAM-dependent methyltransferase [Kutzneria sp. NPDC052558]|uniref:class I SAM-dependent methyltransferase n=1 Tax=Kutzneria sp. NPDC052558 TaxID=3364121 RepID=UPI0037C8979B
MSGGRSFGVDAPRYDRARPGYPGALVDELVGARPLRVVDVGCGTGIASRLFQARGCEVTGVEPDERMAAFARDHGIDVETTTFERWPTPQRRFDLLVCAQAWHWVDPVEGPRKAANALVPGGRIGLIWNFAEQPAELNAALRASYRELAPELMDELKQPEYPVPVLSEAAWGLDHTGLFTPSVTLSWDWTRDYTTAEWLDLVQTISGYRKLPSDRLDGLLSAVARDIDALGGAFPLRFRTCLVTATRTSRML